MGHQPWKAARVESLTSLEAFEAMRSFVAQFATREPAEFQDRFRQLLTWTEIERDGTTSDPAQWDDWVAAVEQARSRVARGASLDIP